MQGAKPLVRSDLPSVAPLKTPCPVGAGRGFYRGATEGCCSPTGRSDRREGARSVPTGPLRLHEVQEARVGHEVSLRAPPERVSFGPKCLSPLVRSDRREVARSARSEPKGLHKVSLRGFYLRWSEPKGFPSEQSVPPLLLSSQRSKGASLPAKQGWGRFTPHQRLLR